MQGAANHDTISIFKTKERDNDDESEPLSNANNTESDYSETELRGRKSVKKFWISLTSSRNG